MSWKPQQFVQGKWYSNALRFATENEAADNARDLFYRWTASDDWRVVQCDDAVNYRYVDGKLVHLEKDND